MKHDISTIFQKDVDSYYYLCTIAYYNSNDSIWNCVVSINGDMILNNISHILTCSLHYSARRPYEIQKWLENHGFVCQHFDKAKDHDLIDKYISRSLLKFDMEALMNELLEYLNVKTCAV